MLTLFRIVELAAGSIYIDGIDISKLGLRTLRQRLSIIPQVRLPLSVLSSPYTDCVSRTHCYSTELFDPTSTPSESTKTPSSGPLSSERGS